MLHCGKNRFWQSEGIQDWFIPSKRVLGCAQSRAELLDSTELQGKNCFSISCVPLPLQAPNSEATGEKKGRKCHSFLGNFILTVSLNGKILNQSYFHRNQEFRVFIYLLVTNKTKLPVKNSPCALCKQAGDDAAGREWDWKMSDPKITSPSATSFGEGLRSLLCLVKHWRHSILLPGGVCCCLGCSSPVGTANSQAGNHLCFYGNIVSAKTSNRTWSPRMAISWGADPLNITIPGKTSPLFLIRCDFL